MDNVVNRERVKAQALSCAPDAMSIRYLHNTAWEAVALVQCPNDNDSTYKQWLEACSAAGIETSIQRRQETVDGTFYEVHVTIV